jgi:putative membrane protein insertion efficiency factor
MTVPAPGQWPRALLAAPIRAYRFLLSPWLGSACRFEPTCSRYALDALEQRGAAAGAYLAARRVLRCHPWCDGGFDPVPPRARPSTPPRQESRPS